MDDALREARKAYDGGTSDPPVALFMAGLLINKGEKQSASTLLESVAGRIPASDVQGQQLLRSYRKELSGTVD
jgi:predicted Zn-dependent protease